MAELAVGLSKSVLIGAITKVHSAIDKDSKLRQKAQGDLVFISLELEMIQAFLDDANEEMKNNLVKTWVKHVRELAYDVEDCVENVVHLDDKPIFWRRLLPSFLAPALPLDLAVEDLGKLKGRVEDVNNCYRRYSNINDTSAVSKLAAAVMQQQPSRMLPVVSHMLAEARGNTTRHQGFGDLTRLITKGKSLQVISVWGTSGDHGMTSIIKRTFNDPEIYKNFTNRSWVKLMHPFSPHDFIRSMMAQFYTNCCNDTIVGIHVLAKMEATKEDLLRDFEKLVTEEKYLVVLEGMSNMVEWEAIRTFLPATDKGSCIIVSTQQVEIATLCVGQFYMILELEKFSDNHSISALFHVQDDEGDANKDHKVVVVKSVDTQASQGDANKAKIPMGYGHVGRESQIHELCKYLAKTCANSPPIMSVLGISGVGKTALVKTLFEIADNNDEYEKYFWVDLCQPFNVREFYMTLFSDVHMMRDPIEECHYLLKNWKCLIVIDELQSTRDWDLMQPALVTRYSKSVIIVITNNASVAKYCTNNEDLIFNVKSLRVDEATNLFERQLFENNPPLKVQDGEVQELISKCGGLPKVIAAVAWLVASKEGNRMDTVRSLNHRFMHHLETDPDSGNLRDLFGWLHSMVLNPPDFLKPCIFYLSIFPQGQVIRRRRLVRRWIAEGYSRESVEMQAEENGEMFFSELLELSIFQQVQLDYTGALNDTRMVVYQVNGFIREYIMSRKMDENLVFELGGSRAVTPQSRGRHLIILTSWDRDKIVFENIDFSRLRSLTVFGKWESFFISKSMKILRVLDLEDASGVTDGDIQIMVKLLLRLKFLSLRGCSEIYNLPSSLGDLRQLETLDIRGTSIITLPNNITKCKKLQYIRAGSTTPALPTAPISSSRSAKFFRRRQQTGVVVCGGIGKLTALHTLGVINVTASGAETILKELNKLTQLRKLGVSGINRRNSKKLFAPVSGRRHLISLSVQLDKGNEGSLDNISIAWAVNLASLKLYGLGDRLPNSIQKLCKLTKLVLEMEALIQIDIELLAKLPQLCILRLCVKQLEDGKLHFHAEMYGDELDTFEKVKILEIACSSSSLHVIFGSKSMKNLELLTLDCSNASYQLTGLNHLSDLKQVLLKGTNDETIKTDLESQLSNHPKIPSVKLEEVLCLSTRST